jgi:ABC-type uncharacterized transport system substrate-binding protein
MKPCHHLVLLIGPLLLAVLAGCFAQPGSDSKQQTSPPRNEIPSRHLGRVFIVNSYHRGYSFSDRETKAILQGLGLTPPGPLGLIDDRSAPVSARLRYLDAKRITDPTTMANRAEQIAQEIRDWQADLVICTDDYAVGQVLKPHVVPMGLPALYCGVNLSADEYQLPPEQVTGMVELNLFSDMIRSLRRYAAGDRIAFIGADTATNRKQCDELSQTVGDTLLARYFYQSLEELKTQLSHANEIADILVVGNMVPVIIDAEDPAFAQAKELFHNHCRIPSGTTSNWHAPLVLMTFAKSPEEMGNWVATQALAILRGKQPADIPIAHNHQHQLSLNMDLAKRMNIRFPIEWLDRARLIGADIPRILFVNSYHAGYAWSDGIEAGLCHALGITDTSGTIRYGQQLALHIFRMDCKHQQNETARLAAASAAMSVLRKWQPDLLITADDAAAKYLLAAYRDEITIPTIFCGVNWDASIYNLPDTNGTGMVEMDPIMNVIDELRHHADGERIGYLGADVLSVHKNLKAYQEQLNLQFTTGHLVRSMPELQEAYRKLQEQVDMLFWLSPVEIAGYSEPDILDLVRQETRIPSGGTIIATTPIACFSCIRLPEEQGCWSGETARRILAGTPAGSIPVTHNQGYQIVINHSLASRLNLHFQPGLLAEAMIIEP